MKRLLALLLLLLSLPLLTGCDRLSPEKQAYVLCLALDYAQDGKLLITVQIPQSAPSEGDNDYAVLSIGADTFERGMERMEAAVPYPLNFSQFRLCVLGAEYAARADLRALLRTLMDQPELRTSASIAVAAGNAAEVLRQQKPDFGMRLSKHIDKTLGTLRDEGLIPDSRISYCVRDLEQGRCDPLLIFCAVNPALAKQEEESKTTQPAQPAAAMLAPDDMAGALLHSGNNPVEILGAAVTSNGRVAGQLTGWEMRLCAQAGAEGEVRVAAGEGGAQLQLLLPQSMLARQKDCEALLQKLQSLQSDALGFGHAAAQAFLTETALAEYGFAERYPQAALYIGIK